MVRDIVCEIAGLKVYIQGCSEYFEKRAAEYMIPFLSNPAADCDIHISIKSAEELPPLVGIGKTCNDLQWKFTKEDDSLLSEEYPASVFKTVPGYDDFTSAIMRFTEKKTEISIVRPKNMSNTGHNDIRDFIYSGQAISTLMPNRDRMVLHSSCISVNGKAVLFSAPSGTGKSTHTGLWKKHIPETKYINDDTPILHFKKNHGIFAYGSPWSGKTELNANISAPLAAVVLLERGNENQIFRIGGTEAFARVLGEARKLPFKKSMEKTAELCGRLIDEVPIYRLKCTISEEAVKTVYKEIFADNAERG